MDIKQKTKKEALIEIFNKEQEIMVYDEINISFFEEKAKNFKKISPEYKNSILKADEMKASLFYRKILLRVIQSMIDKIE